MESITSADGTEIAYERRGEGPPAVLVHGSTADHRSWDWVAPLLEDELTLHIMDRRGRGESGDTEPYDIEREFEDVAALVDTIGDEVFLIGHSYGALASFGASRLTDNIRCMAIFEPPLWTPEKPVAPDNVLDDLYELVEADDREGIIETFFIDVAESPERLEAYRELGTWDMRVAAAPTLPREVEGTNVYRPDREDFAGVTVQTLVLLGAETEGHLPYGTRRAADMLPAAELQVIDGVDHSAIYEHPETFVDAVLPFLRGD